MAEDDACQKSSKIARFIPKPQKVAPKKTDYHQVYASKASQDRSPVDPEQHWHWQPRQSPREYKGEGTSEDRSSRRSLRVGDRVLISGTRYGTLRYLGETQFSDGIWCGVELDEPSGGKHSGVVNGIQYFACRPNYGIFAPVTKVELVISEPKFSQKTQYYLPELSLTPEPIQVQQSSNGGASVKNKIPSFLSRLPKLGIPGRNSGSCCTKDQRSAKEENSGLATKSASCRSYDNWNDDSYDSEPVQRGYRSASPSYSGAYASVRDNSSGSLGYSVRDTSAVNVSFSGSYTHEIRDERRRSQTSKELNTPFGADKVSPAGAGHANDEFSPVHDEWEKSEHNSEQDEVSNAEESVGGAEYLTPIREAMDDGDDFSHQGSLGILHGSVMNDTSASCEGLSGFVPKSFSTDDVADLPEEECVDPGAVGGAASSSDDKVPTFISSEVLRILRYNFPDLVDNLNSVIARNKASLADEFRDISMSTESHSRPPEPQPDAMSKPSTVDSGDYSSGLATSIGSVEGELASIPPSMTHASNALTEVNLSVLQDDDDSHLKRPASVYTVQSTDTGFQGDSELDCQSEVGAAISPCEDKTMRWSTCSSQDSGAVSESGSEFQRRNLHLDCCSESYNVAPSGGQCRLPLLRAQDEPKQEDVPVSSDEAKSEEAGHESETNVEHVEEVSQSNECEKQHEVVEHSGDKNEPSSPSRQKTESAEPVSPSKKCNGDAVVKKKLGRPTPKVVVSKIKAMIEASSSKLESETAAVAKRAARQPKKNKWDAVTSRIQASMADEKAKPKVKEIKSKVFTNLEAAKQQPKSTPVQIHRRLMPSSASSRASTRTMTECDNTSTASEQYRSDSRRGSLASPAGEDSTSSTRNDTAESVTTVNVGGAARPGELESVPSDKGTVTTEKKSKGPMKRPEYPRPWMVSKTQTKEAQNEASTPQSAIAKRPLTSPTQQKASSCMPKSVHFSTPSTGQGHRQTEFKKPNSTLRVPQGVPTRGKAGGDTRGGHPLTKAEFTKEIQRLGALCEARTKEANFLKLQLKHASAGFAAFGVLLRHLTEQHDVFSVPHLTEELRKSREEIDRAHATIEQYKVDIEELKQKQLGEIETMKAKILQKHAAQLEELEAAHKSEIAFYTESHATKTEELKSFYSGIIEEDRKSRDDAIDALKEKHKEKIEAINEEYSILLDAINEEHAAEQAQLEAKHAALMDQYRALQEQAREFQSSVLLDTDAKIQWLSKKNADLQKEVESLNVVLEMRAEQIQALQRSKLEMERKEEELERCKDRIQKLEARNEDLQELLNEKVKLQSQLSVENAVLRENSEKQNRQLSRLDMHNEELKYKLRENSNQSFTYERGSTKARTTPPKRFSVADPTAMSRSWHSERSRVTGPATRKTSSLRSHQRSQTLPHNGEKACTLPDNRRVRRSMSDSVPVDDTVQTRLFSTDEEDDGNCEIERHQCSHDELLRLTWVCSPEDSDNSKVPNHCKRSPNPPTSSSSESVGSLPDQAYHDAFSDGSSSVEGADTTLHASPILKESSPRNLAGEAMIIDEAVSSNTSTMVENNLT